MRYHRHTTRQLQGGKYDLILGPSRPVLYGLHVVCTCVRTPPYQEAYLHNQTKMKDGRNATDKIKTNSILACN